MADGNPRTLNAALALAKSLLENAKADAVVLQLRQAVDFAHRRLIVEEEVLAIQDMEGFLTLLHSEVERIAARKEGSVVDDKMLLIAMHNVTLDMTSVYSESSASQKATELMNTVVELLRRVLGAADEISLEGLRNLIFTLVERGLWNDALAKMAQFAEASSNRNVLYQEDIPGFLIDFDYDFRSISDDSEDAKVAIGYYERLLPFLERTEPYHPGTLAAACNLFNCLAASNLPDSFSRAKESASRAAAQMDKMFSLSESDRGPVSAKVLRKAAEIYAQYALCLECSEEPHDEALAIESRKRSDSLMERVLAEEQPSKRDA